MAQTTPPASASGAPHGSNEVFKTYHLQAGSGANYGNEVLLGLRVLVDPGCKLVLLSDENAIMLRCSPENLAVANQILRELDKPRPNYRLTYTIVESENGKRIGVQHFALTMIAGVRTTLKDGSKVPVATGSYSSGSAAAQTQFTFLDIGLSFDATLDPGADGLRLRSKVEQSSFEEDKTIAGITEPIVRQATLEGSATLQPGKPTMLGTLDLAGSPRHLEVEVLLEVIK